MSAPQHPSEVLHLLQDLISIESHIQTSGCEERIGKYLADWFLARGIQAELQPVEGTRANVIARIRGGRGPTLMLNGHLDTVPAGNMQDAFVPRLVDNIVWGRGACDMKGAIAAMACALVDIQQAVQNGEFSMNGDLLFTGTVGEETGSIGVKAMVDGGVCADYAIVGEPTSLRVGIAHKGACFLRITLVGRGAHGSRPNEGVNAVSYASRLIQTLEGEYKTELSERKHPLLGTPTVSIGRISGGTQPNIVAERCFLDIDRRTLPGEGDPVGEVEALVASTLGSVAGLSFRVQEMEETAVVPHGPLGTQPEALLAQCAASVCQGLGLSGKPVGVTYWTDGGHLAASGLETVILGPGDIANAHGPNDQLPVSELETATQIYTRIARGMLSESPR